MSTDPKPTPAEQAPAQAPIQADAATPEEVGHKVFVGNLSFKTKEEGLVSFFEASGKVLEAKIITVRPHYRKRSAGYGFVTFATLEETTKAANDLNKKELDGREINVEVARPKPVVVEVPEQQQQQQQKPASKPKQKKRRARKNKVTASQQQEGSEDGTTEDVKKTMMPRTTDDSEEERSVTGSDSTPKTKKAAAPRRPKKELTVPSATSLFVGNLPYVSTDETLKDLFKDLKVVSAHVARMRNGRSKGYGFVELESHEEQTKALETIKDVQVEGRTLYLSVALAEAPQEEQAGDASN